jgi:hypothetical protein
MLDFFTHLHFVLTNDADLTAIIPPDNIGASLRQSAEPPLLEYGIDSAEEDPWGHASKDVVLTIYSKNGNAELMHAADLLHRLMTASTLTPAFGSFRTSQVRLISRRTAPRTDWGDAIRCEYSVRLVETAPVHQKQ